MHKEPVTSQKALGKRRMTEEQLMLHYAKQPKVADDSDDEDFKRMHGVPIIPPDSRAFPEPPFTMPVLAQPRSARRTNNNRVDLTTDFLNEDDFDDLYDNDDSNAGTDAPDTPYIEEVQATHDIENGSVTVKLEFGADDLFADPNMTNMDENEARAYLEAKNQLVDVLGLTEHEAREELRKRDEISGGRAW